MFWSINICILTVFQRKLSGTKVTKSKNKNPEVIKFFLEKVHSPESETQKVKQWYPAPCLHRNSPCTVQELC